jgi:hypothetical protein
LGPVAKQAGEGGAAGCRQREKWDGRVATSKRAVKKEVDALLEMLHNSISLLLTNKTI